MKLGLTHTLRESRGAILGRPAVAISLALAMTVVAGGDLMEVIPLFAPVVASPFFHYFHEGHDLLAVLLAVGAAYRWHPAMGAWAILFFMSIHVPYFVLEFPPDGPESARRILVAVTALVSIGLIYELRRANHIVRVRERELAGLITASPTGMYVLQDGGFRFVNPHFQRSTGYSLEELIGRDCLSWVLPEDRAMVRDAAVRMLKGGPASPYEYRVAAKSGETRWILETVVSVDYQGGRASLGNFVDITERKRAEAQAAERTGRLAALYQVSRALGGSLDLATVAGQALHAVLDALGLDGGVIRHMDDATGELVLLADTGLPPEMAQEFHASPRLKTGQGLAGMVAQSGDPIIVEDVGNDPRTLLSSTRRSGFQSWVGLPLKAKGQLVGVISSFSRCRRTFSPGDVETLSSVATMVGMAIASSRLFSQVEARKQEWEQTFDSISDAIAILSPDFRILRINHALAQMLSTTHEAVVGRRCYEVFHGASSPIAGCPVVACLAERRHQSSVVNDLRVGNRWFEVSADPVLGAQGQVQSILHIIKDITERKRAEAALQEANRSLEKALVELRETQRQVIQQERLRALGEMASGIAHDFNNSLTPILGFTELLLARPEKLGHREEVERSLRIMNTAARDAATVVSRLRHFYRGRLEGEALVPVNLYDVVAQAISVTQTKWKDEALARGIRITIRTDLAEVPAVSGDASELQTTLANLLFNAVDAMPRDGTITVRVRPEGQYVALEVADTGTGMTDEVRQRCLEPFFTTKGPQGTGMGLATVHGIVRRHEGTIEIQSQLGKGTTFIIRLPVHRQESERKDGASADFKRAPPLRILVVDDEPLVRQMLAEYLTSDAHIVETASDGREGLEKFRADSFHLVLVDRAMPEMSGDQVAEVIKRERPGTPVIMLTGFAEVMEVTSQKPAGVDLVVGKPVTLSELQRAVAEVAAKHGLPGMKAGPAQLGTASDG